MFQFNIHPTRGFTLIEIMVVVALAGILAARVMFLEFIAIRYL